MFWKVALASALMLQGQPTDDASSGVYLSKTDGALLAQMCPRDWMPGKYDPCGAYLTGVIDGLAYGGFICIAEAVGFSQLAAMGHKHLWDHPEMWDHHVAGITLAALEPRFAYTK